MKLKLLADTHLAKFLCKEDIGFANPRRYVSVALSVSMIPTNMAAKAVGRHIPQLNKMYRAATTKPMKGFASQPKQQHLFTVSLIFHKLLGWSTLCSEPLRWHCRLETHREMSSRMKRCRINQSILKPTEKPHFNVFFVFFKYPCSAYVFLCCAVFVCITLDCKPHTLMWKKTWLQGHCAVVLDHLEAPYWRCVPPSPSQREKNKTCGLHIRHQPFCAKWKQSISEHAVLGWFLQKEVAENHLHTLTRTPAFTERKSLLTIRLCICWQ